MAKKKSKATTSQFSVLVLRALKQEVNQKAGDLIENVLKPKHVEPPPRGRQLNYLVDITTKWHGSKCYFISVYRSPARTPSRPPSRRSSPAWSMPVTASSPLPSSGTPASGSSFTMPLAWTSA